MRQHCLIPLYLLLLGPFLAASRPTYAMGPDGAAGQPTQAEIEAAIKKLSPGATIRWEYEANSAAGAGAGIDAQGTEIDVAGKGSAPESKLDGVGSGKGGSHESTIHALSLDDNTLKLLVGGVGVLCLLGAGLCVYLRWSIPRAPIMLAVTGAALIVAAFFPGVVLFVLLAAVGGGVIYVLWSERNGTRASEALRAVVAGVSDVPSDIGESVRRSIKAHADAADKATIAKVKFKDGLK